MSSHFGHILPYNGVIPKIADSAFVAPTATIIGDVEIGENSNIWYGCVLRGDVNKIIIGKNSNIQDNSVIHVADMTNPIPQKPLSDILTGYGHRPGAAYIGDFVTVGHSALLHACYIADHAFVGMQATVLDNGVLQPYSMIGAASLLRGGMIVPSHYLWAGVPAFERRPLHEKDITNIEWSWKNYVKLAKNHCQSLKKQP